MDWDKLKAFYAVAQAGSFTHAAEKLALTQPSISRKISALESELNSPLFHRHARGLVLTEQGDILYDTVANIFATLSDTEKALKYSTQNEEGPLCITASEMMTQSWLFSVLPDFVKAHPKIQLSILETDKVLNLDQREADIAIRLFNPKQQDLIQKKLKDINFNLVATKQYLEKFGTPKTIKDLRKHVLIAYPDGIPAPFPCPNWHLDTAETDINKQEKKILSSSFSGTLKFIKAGCGIGTMNHFEIQKDENLQIIMPETFQHTVEAYFVYTQEQRRSKRVNILKEFLTKEKRYGV